MRALSASLSIRALLLCGFVVIGLALVTAERAHAERPEFKISVSPKEGTLDSTFVVIVEFERAGLSGPDRYWPPSTSQFRIVDSQVKRGTQSRVHPTRGQELRTTEVHRYVLAPTKRGRLLIGPAKIRIDGEDWETKQLAVHVEPSRDPGAEGGASSTRAGIGHTDARGLNAPGYTPPTGPRPEVFLYALADKKRAWVGEQITVSWLLFARTEILKYEPSPPRLSGLWSESLFEPGAFFQYSDARIGKEDYVVAMVSKRAVFATKGGTLVLKPLQARIATVATALGRLETIASNPIEIEIQELPEPKPPGFDRNSVGNFTLAATVDRDLLQAGQPLTLSVRIRGQGALSRISPPRLRFPGFVFESPRDFQYTAKHQGDTVAGERLFRYWTTPTRGGEQSIPPIELPYFDPKLGRYEVTRSLPIGVTVEGDPEAANAAAKSRADGLALARDIRLLHATSTLQSRVLIDLHERSLFWWLLFVPPFGFTVVVLGDRFRRRLRKETPRVRLRRARGRARALFRVAEIHQRGQRPAKFFASLSHAIYEHLEAWLDHNLQSMTQRELRSFLSLRGFDKQMIRRITDLLDDFDKARFAPVDIGDKEMREAVEHTKNLLESVEKIALQDERSNEEAS